MARYDVVISGAGPAGSTAALALARLGARVALLDRATFPRDKPCAEYLSPEINVLLRDLGLTARIDAAGARHLRGFHVYTQDGRGFTGNFASRSGGVAERAYGLAIPRALFDHALVRAATEAGAALREGMRVTGLEQRPGGIALRALRHGKEETVEARFAIAADGLRSPLARALGLVERRAPHRIALVTHMAGVEGLDEYGEMHASPAGGYCGIAPFYDGSAVVSMVVDERDGRRIGGDRAGYLRAALACYPRLSRRTHHARLCKPVLATSGLSQHARRFYGQRVALAGDAAGYYDPFTGEGIYRAMASGRLAAARLGQALDHGNHGAALRAYDRELRQLFRGKHLVERIVDLVVQRPLLFAYVARRLRQHPDMADTLVGVTGDFLSPWNVLNPGYMARLLAYW